MEALRGAEEFLTKFGSAGYDYCQAQYRWTEQGDDHCDMKYTDNNSAVSYAWQANYGSFFGYSLEMKIPVASINLHIICTMLMYCVHKLVKPFHKLTT